MIAVDMSTKILDFIILYKELFVIILSPVIAVAIGEWLRARNYKKWQRDDLVRRLLSYGYQMSPTHQSTKDGILSALNEIKYWYARDKCMRELIFLVMDKMKQGEDAQDDFIILMQRIGEKEGYRLSREVVERIFSVR